MNIKDMSLEEIAEELSVNEVTALQYVKSQDYMLPMREKIESQAPSAKEIIGQYTSMQYIEQQVEIMPGLKALFRTIPPWAMDESLEYAQEKSKTRDQTSRILSRRRLSYALMEINDEPIATLGLQGSYFDMLRADPELFKEKLKIFADNVYNHLCFFGLADKVSEAFGIWENVIFNRLNGIEDVSDTLKNSTRGSTPEQ